MPSGPLLAALAARALDEQEAAQPGRHRFRRLAARVGQLAARQAPEAPVGAGEESLDRPHTQGQRRRDLPSLRSP
jgi:hypothetical protein